MTYNPVYTPSRMDRFVDWFNANAPIMFSGFTLGAILTGAAIF